MIIDRLLPVAERLAADGTIQPGYRPRTIKWVLRITADGQPADPPVIGYPDDSPRMAGPDRYRSGTTPPAMLGIDNLKYTLAFAGHLPDDATAAQTTAHTAASTKAAARHDDWVRMHTVAAAEHPGSGRLAAVAAWSASPVRPDPPANAKPNDWCAIEVVGHGWLHDDPAVAAAWSDRLGDGLPVGTCQLTGETGPVVTEWPTALSAFGKAKVSAVKADRTAYIDHRAGRPNVGLSTAMTITAALDYLLTGDNSRRLPDDTRMVWWSDTPVDTNPLALLLGGPSEDDIADLLDSPRTGRSAPPVDTDRWTLAHLSARSDARLVIHRSLDGTLPELDHLLRLWTADITIDGPNGPIRPGIAWMARAVDDNSDAQRGRIQAGLLLAALTGSRPERAVIGRAVARALMPDGIDLALVGLLTLNHRRTHGDAMPLDETCTDHAYLLGRAIAAAEDIQTAHRPGTARTIADRVMRTVGSRPAKALGELDRTVRVHANGLTGKGKAGLAHHLTGTYQQILALMDPDGMPQRLDTDGRARLILGYHHQTAHRPATNGTDLDAHTDQETLA